MEKTSQAVDDKLLDYLDGTLAESERQNLEQQIQRNAAIKTRLESLRSTHELLKQFNIEQPSRNFTHALMQRIDQAPARSTFSIRNGVFLLIGVLVTVGLAAMLVSIGVFDNPSTIELNNLDIPEKYLQHPLPSIPVSGKTIVNIIIMLNLGLAWIVLDRAILKPLFQRRIQTR